MPKKTSPWDETNRKPAVLVSHEKNRTRIWAFTTAEEKRAAILAFVHTHDVVGDYADLDREQPSLFTDHETSGQRFLHAQRLALNAAREGDADAAWMLAGMREDYQYEEWEVVTLEVA